MASRKRNIGREILGGIRELKRGEHGGTTKVPKRKSKQAKRIMTAPSKASPISGGEVLSVEIGSDEQVEWVWNHDHERGSYVAGYRIVPRVLVENLDKPDSTVDVQWLQEMEDHLAATTLTDEQRADLDRRLAEYGNNPDAGSPWSEVKARILKGADHGPAL